MSSGVVKRDKLKRTLAWSNTGATPMANNTGDGSREPELHAAPALAHTPALESANTMASASKCANAILLVFHTLDAPMPLITASGLDV